MTTPKPGSRINQHIGAAIKSVVEKPTERGPSNTRGLDVFLDFDTSSDNKDESRQLKEMLQAAYDFVADIDQSKPPRWLTLLGTSGAGKTMLCERIITWAKKTQSLRLDPRNRTNEQWLCRVGLLRWSSCVSYMLQGDYGWIPQAKHDWIVAIDDIGVEYDRVRALATSKLYEILEARRGLWTVITANPSVQEIGEKMDPRIASRLFRDQSDVIDITVEDYNIRQFKKRKKHPVR